MWIRRDLRGLKRPVSLEAHMVLWSLRLLSLLLLLFSRSLSSTGGCQDGAPTEFLVPMEFPNHWLYD